MSGAASVSREDERIVDSIVACVRKAAKYGDDSVALGVLMLSCSEAGHPLAKEDARDLIRRARRRPDLRVL